MNYLEAASYWSNPGPTTLPRVVELGNWLYNVKKFCPNNCYGQDYIKRMCDEFDNTPGAGPALIEAGYLVKREKELSSWWIFRYPSILHSYT